jgi:hypothetical protein
VPIKPSLDLLAAVVLITESIATIAVDGTVSVAQGNFATERSAVDALPFGALVATRAGKESLAKERSGLSVDAFQHLILGRGQGRIVRHGGWGEEKGERRAAEMTTYPGEPLGGVLESCEKLSGSP